MKPVDAARAAGMPDSQGMRDVLSGRKRLTVELLAALVPVGIDVSYVVTGQHSAKASARAVSKGESALSDRARLAAAVGAVEEGLSETKRKLPPAKRAELILAAYDLMAEPQQTRANVIRLVRMAA